MNKENNEITYRVYDEGIYRWKKKNKDYFKFMVVMHYKKGIYNINIITDTNGEILNIAEINHKDLTEKDYKDIQVLAILLEEEIKKEIRNIIDSRNNIIKENIEYNIEFIYADIEKYIVSINAEYDNINYKYMVEFNENFKVESWNVEMKDKDKHTRRKEYIFLGIIDDIISELKSNIAEEIIPKEAE